MECPNCNTQMIKGFMVQNHLWVTKISSLAKLGAGKDVVDVFTFRCPTCGILEKRAVSENIK